MIILTLPVWYMNWASTIFLIQNDQNNGRFKININPCLKRHKRSIVGGILIILVIVIIASVVASVTSNARTKGKFHFNKIRRSFNDLFICKIIVVPFNDIYFIYFFNKTLNQFMYDQSNDISMYY